MFRRLGPGALVLLHIFLLLQVTLGAITNRTIDDTLGDSVTHVRPVYSPSQNGVWEDSTCKGCIISPDKSKAFQGTWTAATYNAGLKIMSIDLAFKGTAIYVFFLLANDEGPGITTLTECDFILDNNKVSSFRHTPSTSHDLQYNALVFSTANLPNVDHKLSIVTAGKNYDVFVNFDYAIYTADDGVTSSSPLEKPSSSPSPSSPSSLSSPSSPSSPSSLSPSPSPSSSTSESLSVSTSTVSRIISTTVSVSPGSASTSTQLQPSILSAANTTSNNGAPIGAIVGGTLGGLAVLGALAALLFVCCRRRREEPFEDDLLHTTRNHVSGFSYNVGGTGRSSLPYVQSYRDQVSHQHTPSTDTISRYGPNQVMTFVAPQSNMSNILEGPLSNPHSPRNSWDTPSLSNGEDLVFASTTGLHGASATTSSASSPALHSTEEIRHARQLALDQQIQAARQEMQDLKSEVGRRVSMSPRALPRNDEEEMNAIKEQMQAMRQQIEYLQSQQQSPWARGLSDDPPPGYTFEHSMQNSQSP